MTPWLPAVGLSALGLPELWLPLAAKALATALIVIAASVTAERLGPVWGAIIACLPVSTGPAYVFLALQHGPAFVAASALDSTATNAATGLFLVVYGFLGRRIPPWRSLGLAMLVWFAASLLVQRTAWTPGSAVLLNLAVYVPAIVLARQCRAPEATPGRPVRRRWFDLPLRAALVASFVALVVTVSSALGPQVTGIAAVFPVSLTSLIVLLLPRLGGPATAHVASSALPPMLGFGGLLLALHLAAVPWGVPAALALAMAVSVLWSGLLLLIEARGRPGGTPAARRSQEIE